MNVADRILLLRKQKGLSQEQLADEIGVSRQLVSKWENEQAIPDMERIMILSEYFETTTDYLLKGIEPIKPCENVHDKVQANFLDSNFIDVILWIVIVLCSVIIIYFLCTFFLLPSGMTIDPVGSETYMSEFSLYMSVLGMVPEWWISWILLLCCACYEAYRIFQRKKKLKTAHVNLVIKK